MPVTACGVSFVRKCRLLRKSLRSDAGISRGLWPIVGRRRSPRARVFVPVLIGHVTGSVSLETPEVCRHSEKHASRTLGLRFYLVETRIKMCTAGRNAQRRQRPWSPRTQALGAERQPLGQTLVLRGRHGQHLWPLASYGRPLSF